MIKKIKEYFVRLLFNRKFNRSLKKGKLLSVNHEHRNVDRKKVLLEYSIKNNIPIVVSKQDTWYQYKEMDINVDLVRLANNFKIDFRDRKFPNGVLIDESVQSDMIEWLKTEGILINGGFMRKEGNNQ